MVFTLLLAPAFYAKKDYRTPTLISLTSIGLSLCLNTLLIFVFHFGPASLAFSTSLTACLNAYLLFRQLAQKTGISFSPGFFQSIGKTVICSVIAGMLTFWVDTLYIEDHFVRGFGKQFSQFIVLFIVFSIGFIGSALLLKREELFNLFGTKLESR